MPWSAGWLGCQRRDWLLTMGPNLERLLALAGPPLGPPVLKIGDVPAELAGLLSRSNGFVAFESALYVFPLGVVFDPAISLESWNEPGLWRAGYGAMADGLLFFAQDIFGGQFALSWGGVVSFDPETGDVSQIGDDLDAWAAEILADYELLTGFPLAHAWQQCHGQLAASK